MISDETARGVLDSIVSTVTETVENGSSESSSKTTDDGTTNEKEISQACAELTANRLKQLVRVFLKY